MIARGSGYAGRGVQDFDWPDRSWELYGFVNRTNVVVSDKGYVTCSLDPVEDRDARRTIYTVDDDGHELVIVLEGRGCQDTMSGEEFETTVIVVVDGKEVRGVGERVALKEIGDQCYDSRYFSDP